VLRRFAHRDRADRFLLSGPRRRRRPAAAPRMRTVVAGPAARPGATHRGHSAGGALRSAAIPRRSLQRYARRDGAGMERIRADLFPTAPSVAPQPALVQEESVVRAQAGTRTAPADRVCRHAIVQRISASPTRCKSTPTEYVF